MQALDDISKRVEQVIMEELDLDERPAFVLNIALPPDHKRIHYSANVSREDGVGILANTLSHMQAQEN